MYLEDFHLAVWLTQLFGGKCLHESCTHVVKSPVLHTYNDVMYKYYATFVFLRFNRLLLCCGQSMNVDPAILSAWPHSGTSAII